ncbi:MAG TPA: SDR family NAD(P)-dependent oxidoreductase [Deltaproteobacteria bacterium]|nr:SDR family NAD(P)-dependent oxidoreductase [Deltaproteobacteria bacterium]
MNLNFTGKTVLITGSSMGIGRGLSACFARDGANLFLTDLPSCEEKVVVWADELTRRHNITTWTFCTDLTRPDGPETLHREVTAQAGVLHTLVNNAGICSYGRFDTMDHERLEKMVLLNCMGYAKLMRLFLPSMIQRNEGAVLNVSSVSAFQPLPSIALYAASKAFTQSLTEGIASELPWKSRVRVATMNPPFTRTGLISEAGFPEDFIPFSISLKTIEEVTELGYTAFKNGRLFFVPGWQNKLLHLCIGRILPRRGINLIARISMRAWSDLIPWRRPG